MQQSVYGETAPSVHNQQSVMKPTGFSPSRGYASAPSPSAKQSPNNIMIQNVLNFPPGQIVGSALSMNNQSRYQLMGSNQQRMHGQEMSSGQAVPGQITAPTQIRMAAGANVTGSRPRMPNIEGTRPSMRPGMQEYGQVRGALRQRPRMPLKRRGTVRRPDMLLPGEHVYEDCQVMSKQKQRDGLPMVQSMQGAKDKLDLGSQISITKITVNKEANAMAKELASRGISVKQNQKVRSLSPQRPLPNIPNLGAGVSVEHSSKSSNYLIAKACKKRKKMCTDSTSLSVHMKNAHPQSKLPAFKCDECPAFYLKSLQLKHHKKVFHNVSGHNKELELPVVDLSQEDNLKRLIDLGIYSFIPLANRKKAKECFGIPVISVHNVQNGMTSSLQALGADGLLSLGPLKHLPSSLNIKTP